MNAHYEMSHDEIARTRLNLVFERGPVPAGATAA